MVVANWPLFSHTFYKGLDLQLLKIESALRDKLSLSLRQWEWDTLLRQQHPVSASCDTYNLTDFSYKSVSLLWYGESRPI